MLAPIPGESEIIDDMRDAGQPDAAIQNFVHYYRQLVAGVSGQIPESTIQPVEALPRLADLQSFTSAGREVLDRAVVIKLNGGLGTSMGMTRAKSLVVVKEGLSFLDLAARQVLELRHSEGVDLPLLLMNSFRTRADTREALVEYPDLDVGMPLDFLQHQVPKIDAETLLPVDHPDPEHRFCPPGHGDLYIALRTSGLLQQLLARGYQYAFVSNADNLGATLDPALLGYMVQRRLAFVMEVCARTEADKKGGHLAREHTGALVLREAAQCPPDELDAFQDWRRHRYFNTNNLWVDLKALRDLLDARGDVLGLPMIRNRKTADPNDPRSRPVYQLETAMGAAIGLFEEAGAVEVPRIRFAPVKTTNDLLVLWSDRYLRAPTERIDPNPINTPPDIVVDLDPAYYRRVDQLAARFPKGAPSLARCGRFTVRGDVTFGAGVVATGDVTVAPEGPGPHRIPDGAHLGS